MQQGGNERNFYGKNLTHREGFRSGFQPPNKPPNGPRLTQEEKDELRKQNKCFICKSPWQRGHK